jgi:hypothetical protein
MKWALASSIVRSVEALLSMVHNDNRQPGAHGSASSSCGLVYVVAHSIEHAGSLIAESSA